MLVLARKENEGIMIGELIEVTVVKISGDRVKLGFRGPQTVRILRQELTTRSDMEPSRTAEDTAPCFSAGR